MATCLLWGGSLLETIIRRWFLLTMTFVVVPLLVSLLIEHITSFRDEMTITSDLSTIISFHVQQVITQDIPFTVLLFLWTFFWTAILLQFSHRESILDISHTTGRHEGRVHERRKRQRAGDGESPASVPRGRPPSDLASIRKQSRSRRGTNAIWPCFNGKCR